jgi:hypothetical protein
MSANGFPKGNGDEKPVTYPDGKAEEGKADVTPLNEVRLNAEHRRFPKKSG